MKVLRRSALVALLLIYAASIGANWLASAPFERQNREAILTAPCRSFPLGTDDLGRDLFSRVLYGSRISLLLAPASALIATLLALAIAAAASLGGAVAVILHRVIDLFLSLPWLFFLLIVRAMLPLNLSPWLSLFVTFLVLGCFGWAQSARVFSESMTSVSRSEFLLYATAQGQSRWRRLVRHTIPNLKPVIAAQFWICVPVFIIGEANLGFLGLGVGEPLPSWGNLLRQLENYNRVISHPWLLAPLVVLLLVIASFQIAVPSKQTTHA